MIDIALLRKDIDQVAARLQARGYALDVPRFNALEAQRKAIQTKTETLAASRNALSKQIGQAKAKGEDASALMAQVADLPNQLDAAAAELAQVQSELDGWLATIPNLPHESVPTGASSDDNQEVRRWGTPKAFDFEVKDHVDVGASLGLDFEVATKLTGSRFAVMKGGMARLHRALAQYMLDVQTGRHGYTECYTPYIVNADSLFG
ncbi:MAG: hypothetical protein RL483_947, partial [Pseudomonadota bacterium]